MTTVDAHELEVHVREVLRKVEEGETIEVTRYGQVVARMVPVHSQQTSDQAESILEKLQHIQFDGPEDFAANHDLYFSGEKREEPDIH